VPIHQVVDPRELEALVAHVADHVGELVAVLDEAATVRWANRGAERILGYPRTEWIGRSAIELVHPDDVPLAAELLVSAKATGAGVKEPVSYRVRTQARGWIELECIASNVELTTGELAIVFTGREVAVRRPGAAIVDEASRRLAEMFDDAAIGMAQVGLDGRLLRVNTTLAVMLRSTPARLLGRDLVALVHPDDLVDGWPGIAEGASAQTAQQRLVADDGEWVHARVTTSLVRDRFDAPLYCALQVTDLTDVVTMQAALQGSERRFRTLLEVAEEGILILDPTGVISFANRRIADLLGDAPSEMVGRRLTDFVAADALAALEPPTGAVGQPARVEVRLRHRNGAEIWALLALSPQGADTPDGSSSIALVTDITELKHAQAELLHRSHHDPLTGLANRSLLERSLAPDDAPRGTVAVMFIDLDGFKTVNDTYGHATGDVLLIAVAQRLQAAVRSSDVVARVGGDEFVVVCRQLEDRAVVALAHRLVRELEAPFTVAGRTVTIGGSVGLATGDDRSSPRTLMRAADAALYRAKAEGGGQVQRAEPLGPPCASGLER
jgi:diguanylate cyclase (GGDEF)-like protein/PAS domain S-box-containing protein